jgi:cell division protein FtsI/penicillin-binding protein 2
MAAPASSLWDTSASRLRFLRIGLLGLLAFIVWRLVSVQIVDHDHYKGLGAIISSQAIEIHPKRGGIRDIRGRDLASDCPAIAVYVRRDKLSNLDGMSQDLGAILGIPPDRIAHEIASGRGSFVYIDRQADEALKPRIDELARQQPNAVGTEPATRRTHPKGVTAADLLGFTGTDHEGLAGLEASRDRELGGQPGEAVGQRDVTGWPIPHRTVETQPARNGDSLRLALDLDVQEACERELAAGASKFRAQGACAVVMEVKTGNVVAACDYPSYDPDNWKRSTQEDWKPRFATWTYEPGSTMKPLVVAAALSEGVITEGSYFSCNGSYHIASHTLSCSHGPSGGHGSLNAEGILTVSCNIGALQIGLKTGAARLSRLFQSLGFTEPPTNEIASQYQVLPECRVPTWCATVAYGQGLSITPLHLASAYATLANGGVRMRPRVIDATIDPDGLEKREPVVPEGRAFSESAARRVVEMLVNVIDRDEGTGRRARVNGCTIAGKTGTAQIPVPGGFLEDRYVVSFAGIIPANEPRYVVLVVVDRPADGDAYGGTVAAPIFQRIAESLITIEQVPVRSASGNSRGVGEGSARR